MFPTLTVFGLELADPDPNPNPTSTTNVYWILQIMVVLLYLPGGKCGNFQLHMLAKIPQTLDPQTRPQHYIDSTAPMHSGGLKMKSFNMVISFFPISQFVRETGNLDSFSKSCFLKEDVEMLVSPGTKDEPLAFDQLGTYFVTLAVAHHHNFGPLRKTVTAV